MRTRSLEQFPACAEQSFPASPADAPAIGVHRVAFSVLVRRRLWSAIRFADVRANGERLEVVHGGAAVILLVRDHLLDQGDRPQLRVARRPRATSAESLPCRPGPPLAP